jgi:hypothetical protein
MRASLIMRSSHGDVAVSNTDDRRFDSFRACAHRTTSPGTSSLTTAEASSPGIASRRSREWVGRVIASSTDPHMRVTPDGWGTGLLPRNRLGSSPRARTEPP